MKLASRRIRIEDGQPRIYSGPEAQQRVAGRRAGRMPALPGGAAGPEQSRRLTERLGICLRRSLAFREESTRDLAQLLVAFVVALAVMALIGWLFGSN